jgi:uncharacterized phage-associated protein
MSQPGDIAYGIREIANWVLEYAERQQVSISNMQLNKLVYFAYEHALKKYGRKLTNAKIEAWEHGPVFREIYRSFKESGNLPIASRAQKYNPAKDIVEIVVPNIAENDEKILEEALKNKIRLSASVLRELSHASDSPWAAVWYHEGTTNPGMQITDKLILDSQRNRV